jgi:hypothetical protein
MFCMNIIVLRSFLKTPQTLTIKGRDSSGGRSVAGKALEQTMLEIVNAS